ncbi:hypothetical protein FFF34_007120 [Inquilinus sp. KBS0705]|nr:hypothetical protein FFF34_007120 [Inquilinus sp. KBS0705]
MRKKSLLLFVWLLPITIAIAQSDTSAIKANTPIFKALLNLPATEKAYLHFDKPYYAASDTIYFKAYVTMGERHQPSTISGVLHVDLINPLNKIDKSIKLQLINGVAWGDFDLPDTVYMGNYRIRAYTQWMRNDADPTFFERIIPIGGNRTIPNSNMQRAGQADITFFPEGGNLVAGVNSFVAFKAIGGNGLGLDVKGVITDDDNRQVAKFTSSHLGMGGFYFTPAEHKTYRAILTYANGQHSLVDMPAIQSSGLVLSVNNDSIAQATVSIKANAAYLAANRNKDYTLVIYSGGKATSVKYSLDSAVTNLYIMKRRLNTGIATITLFSADNEPLGERLIFVQKYDQLSLKVNSDKLVYNPQEKIDINLNATTRAGLPAKGSFSVSVMDEDKIPVNKSSEHTILTELLLTADLKGYIEQPNYYFTNATELVKHDLDLVMLTHGYRRFEWKQILNNEPAAIAYQPEKALQVNGNARNLYDKPLDKGTISLIPQKGGMLSETTNNKGDFKFTNLIFTDTAKFILQAVSSKGKNGTKLSYNKDEGMPAINPLILQDTTANVLVQTYAQNNNKQLSALGHLKGRVLKEVTIKSSKRYTPKVTSRYGPADQTIPAEEIGENGLLIFKLMPLLRGMRLVPTREPNLYIPELTQPGLPGVKVKIIVNDIEMELGFNINSINPDQVESVDIIRNPLAPAIIFTIKYGVNPRYITSTGILPITVSGFYRAREFYSPKYEHPQDNPVDIRSTIYWKPDLLTDDKGNASFTYYNAGKGNYRVVVEGMDDKGNIGRQVYHYTVK